MEWLDALSHLRREGSPGVLITVVSVRGHAPRDAGAKMVVGSEHSWGSVGGGNLEEAAIRRARQMISTGAAEPETQVARLNEHARNEHGRQCCGGEVTLLLEPMPARPTVAIFGMGHVGYELARILSRLEVRLELADSREDQLDPFRLASITDGAADVAVHHLLLGEQLLERLPRGAHVLIMSHDHAEDFALCDAALRLPALGSIGLIGSSAKWSGFRRRLTQAGHCAADIGRIRCPIGLPDIEGKQPAVIAVSVAAALLQSFQQPSESAPAAEPTVEPAAAPAPASVRPAGATPSGART